MKERLRQLGLGACALFFVAVGVTHFTHPAFFLKIMPPALPAHLALVYLSGVFEILGGLGLLVPRTRRFAGWGLIALLVAVFPANLYMASAPERFPEFSRAALYGRLPFQLVFAAWVLWAAGIFPQLEEESRESSGESSHTSCQPPQS